MDMKTIAIVGGGIGGLAAAVFLAQKGYAISIFDKAPQPEPVGAGFLLQPPGQDILNRLGVLPDILKVSVPITALQSQTVTGRSLLDLEYQRLKGTARNGLGVQRSTIYQALLNRVVPFKNITYQWGSNISKVSEGTNRVTVVSNSDRQQFDFCILSAGANSHLADEHFPNRVKRPYGWGCFWATCVLPAGLAPNVLHQRCRNTNKMMGVLPVKRHDDGYDAALYWSAKSSDIAAFSEQDFAALKQEIMAFWPEVATSVDLLGQQDFITANYHDIWTSKPYTNRLVLIGDIAHATSPQLGQGCTMALLDAWSLGMCLPSSAKQLQKQLAKWWGTRKWQLLYVRHLSRLLTPLFQSESGLCEVFRDRLMAPIGRLPPFYGLQLNTLAGNVFLTADADHR